MKIVFVILFYGLVAYGAISFIKSVFKDDKND